MKHIDTYQTLSQDDLEKETKKSTILDKKYHIEWGMGNSYTLVCEDEDSRRDFERHVKPIIGVTPLKTTRNTYITIDLDNVIQVNSTTGRKLFNLSGHSDRILGIIEPKANRLMSVGLDGTIKLWNMKNGNEVYSISVEIDSFDAITVFPSGDHFSVYEKNRVTIWSFEGNKIAEMAGLKDKIASANQLVNGNWLISYENSHKNPSIWNSSGELVSTFKFNFNIFADVCQLDNEQLLIKHNDEISVWDNSGKLLAVHETNTDVADIFKSLKQSNNSAITHMEQYSDISDYPHIRNPMGFNHIASKPRKELEEQNIDLTNPTRKLFWHFFNKPVTEKIKTTLKDIISRSRKDMDKVDEQIEQTQIELELHTKKRKTRKLISLFFFIISLPSLMFSSAVLYGYINKDPRAAMIFDSMDGLIGGYRAEQSIIGMLVLGAIGFLITLIFFKGNRTHKAKQLQKESNLLVLNQFKPEFEELITSIKTYRNKILRESYAQKVSIGEVSKQIHTIVDEELMQIALDECGIERDDIISADRKPIILKDWSILQDKDKRSFVASQLNPNNEFSFWSANNELIFAVEYIQFIFLTQDKVDIFTTYYDYITGKCMGKEANAFYYKDVTNVSKREVQRPLDKEDMPATEITMSASSGEKIQLTIINQHSLEAIKTSAKENEDTSIEENLEKWRQQIEEIKNDSTISEEEKQSEIEFIEQQIADSNKMEITQDISKIVTVADQAIRNIRAQLQEHKNQLQTVRIAEMEEVIGGGL